MFVNKYTELNTGYNTEGTAYSQILSILLTDYDNLKNKRSNIPSIPEITPKIYAQISEVTLSSSSIGNILFIVLSIFGAIAILLGVSYKFLCCGSHIGVRAKYYIVFIF
ncbi:hypothetical protein YYC_02799 [Plasmodium yoelii 17X]|uniref:YIR protein n=1 Tax=Plasmodium yoelii 17X TaxID=1323249 RepID=V7PM83_PLAYE|nr:hypothetical protein YYC_02799 [Plasmodium yoelii 17X]